MGPALFVIAILGCGEGDAPCQQVRQLETRYESQAACAAATEAAMNANSDAEYPVVVAQCVAAGRPTAEVTPREVKLPGPALPRRAAARSAPLPTG